MSIDRRAVQFMLLAAVACGRSTSVAPASGAMVAQVAQQPSVEAPLLATSPDSVASRLLADVHALDASIRVDLRYRDAGNFTGAPLPGYEANRALLRVEAARALVLASARVRAAGYRLLIWDAYRPARATQAMMDWTERVHREQLVRDGYIARSSRHNLGLAVDLTLVHADGSPVNMGTPFDSFSDSAHTVNASGDVARNRQLLKRLLEAEGFVNYDQEWWHFSYAVTDPRRFDLVIR
ncbi:MAG: peptidase vanX D-ala-D-ala dipeptidase [Gemmatimonadetes bacterium]|nr:peptidase vanX D-ala-D-ala dipeptidase [Gemmatimonadota bacterium]